MPNESLPEILQSRQDLEVQLEAQRAEFYAQAEVLDTELEERKQALLAGDIGAATGNVLHDALIVLYGSRLAEKPGIVNTWEDFAARFEDHVGEPFLAVYRSKGNDSWDNHEGSFIESSYTQTTYHMGIVDDSPISYTQNEQVNLQSRNNEGARFKIDPVRGDYGWLDISSESYDLVIKPAEKEVHLPKSVVGTLPIAWRSEVSKESWLTYDRITRELDEEKLGISGPVLEVVVGKNSIQEWLTQDENSEHYLKLRAMCRLVGIEPIAPPDTFCADILKDGQDRLEAQIEATKEARDADTLGQKLEKLNEELASL